MTRSTKIAVLMLGALALATSTVAVLTLGDGGGDSYESSENPRAGGQGAMEEYVDSIIEPLARAAIDHGHERSEFVPSDADITAALESGSLDSPEGRALMGRLRESYDFFMMRFPGPPEGGQASGIDDGSDRIEASDRAAALRPWFRLRIEELERMAASRGEDASVWLPTEEAVEEAAESGSLDSPASSRVIEGLRQGYRAMDSELRLPR